MRRLPAALLPLALCVGCATTPEPDAEVPISGGREVASSVVVCRTALTDLESRLGRPSRDGRMGDLRVLTWIVEWEPLVRTLGVAVDARGTVVDRVWDLPSEVPWMPADRCGGR